MIDRIFSAALTFALLIGGTVAIGSAMFGLDRQAPAPRVASAPVRVVQLEPVLISARQEARASEVAQTESDTTPPARVQ